MYGWVEDYTDEFVARDWLLKNVDENFKREGIEIPYPTAVEIATQSTPSVNTHRKKTSVRMARMQMIKEDKQLARERASAKGEIEEIAERLKGGDLAKKERAMLEEDLRELNSVLSMFEAGSDD
jgi:hypothetical protein